MKHSFLPRTDTDYAAWLAHFAHAAAENAALLGISAEELAALDNFSTDVRGDVQNVVANRAAFRAAVRKKEETLAVSERFVRPLVRRLQAAAGMDDTLRILLNIAVPAKGVRRTPNVPFALIGKVDGQGGTLLTWNGGENGRGTVYCAERKVSAAGEWVTFAVTGKTRCRDGVTPLGVGVSYRVRAMRGDQYSLYSVPITMHGG